MLVCVCVWGGGGCVDEVCVEVTGCGVRRIGWP